MCSFKLKRLLVCSVGKNGTDLQSPNQRGKKKERKLRIAGTGEYEICILKMKKNV